MSTNRASRTAGAFALVLTLLLALAIAAIGIGPLIILAIILSNP